MKKLATSIIASVFVLAWVSVPALAQGVTTPRTPSPASKVSQTIGISTVTVSYSRPSVRSREVWGKLVPYGWNVQGFGAGKEAPWRAGANENTVIEFSHNATVEGKAVPAGKYGLFFVINNDNTGEVILSKGYQSWGSFFYDPAQDLLRAPIKLRDIAHTEMLTYDFINLDKGSGELVLNWEKKQFPVSIKFAVDDLVIANAKEELKGAKGFSPNGFISAAAYTLQNKVSMDQGLIWIDQAIAQKKEFPSMIVKAGLLEETGKMEESEKIKKESLTVATEAELNNYGYQMLGQTKYDKAIEIFKIATERFPKSANAWDSLGEGYALKGDSKNAIACFKKSLTMNPIESVKANSEKYLKQLGAM
jgi:tetratricopeptide (TPR) repeat protein